MTQQLVHSPCIKAPPRVIVETILSGDAIVDSSLVTQVVPERGGTASCDPVSHGAASSVSAPAPEQQQPQQAEEIGDSSATGDAAEACHSRGAGQGDASASLQRQLHRHRLRQDSALSVLFLVSQV